MQSDSYWKADHPDHAKTMQRLRELLHDGRTDDEREDYADASASELRAVHGIKPPTLPRVLEAAWSEDIEADYLRSFHGAPDVIEGVRDAYIRYSAGQPIGRADVQRMRDEFVDAGKLTAREADLLIA